MELERTPRYSVVTAVLNAVGSLPRALESVLQQNHPDVELIVIDGGSRDGTLEVIDRYAAHLTYWESGQDRGIADAFNRGISHARGELVAILNADDRWLPGALAQVDAACVREPDADIYCGQIRYADPRTGRCYVRRPDVAQMRRRMHLFHPALFVRRSAYVRLGGYSEDYQLAMDCEWCHRAIAAGLRFETVAAVLAEMSLGGRSDVDFAGALREYRRSLLQHGLSSRFAADYHFAKYLLFKTLMRSDHLRLLKQRLLG